MRSGSTPRCRADFARETLQPQSTVQGNLDPVLLLAGGAALEARGDRDPPRRSAAGPYVFNLGHGVLPETPPENVASCSRGCSPEPIDR